MKIKFLLLAVLITGCSSLQPFQLPNSIQGKYEGVKNSRRYVLTINEDGTFLFNNRGQFHSNLFSDGNWKIR